MASAGQFDLNELSRQIDQARRERDLTGSEIALIGWLGVAPEQFIIDSTVAGMIPVDMPLIADLPMASPFTPRYPHNDPTARDGRSGRGCDDCVTDPLRVGRFELPASSPRSRPRCRGLSCHRAILRS